MKKRIKKYQNGTDYLTDYDLQKELGNEYGSSMNQIADTIVGLIPMANMFNAGAETLGSVVDMITPKDKYGVYENALGPTLQGIVNPMNANLNMMGDKEAGSDRYWQTAVNVLLPGLGYSLYNKDKKEKRDDLLEQQKIQQDRQKAFTDRMNKYYKKNMQMAKEGGTIRGNAYVNHNEYIVSPRKPMAIRGGNISKENQGLYKVNAYRDGVDNVEADIQPGSKVINNQLSSFIEPLAEEVRKIDKKLEKGKDMTAIRKRTLENMKGRLNKEIESYIQMQPSNPNPDQKSLPAFEGGTSDFDRSILWNSNQTPYGSDFYPSYEPYALNETFASGSPWDLSTRMDKEIQSYGDSIYNQADESFNDVPLGWHAPMSASNGKKDVKSGDNSFKTWLMNDPTSYLTLGQGAYGLMQLIQNAATPVQRLPDNEIARIGMPKDISPIASSAEKYLRTGPTTTSLSNAGITDPRIWASMYGDRLGTYSQVRTQEEAINKGIEEKNRSLSLQTIMENKNIDERNRGYKTQQKMYYDQGRANQLEGITQGASSIIAMLAKILPMVI